MEPTTTELRLRTSDGVDLEAQVATVAESEAAIVLAHPHPLFGGDMHSGVISELFRILPTHGLTCVRFNFRGVGASSGSHGEGRAEVADVIAALDAVEDRADTAPILVIGWSFGADVALRVADARIAAWCAITPPLADPDEMAAATDPRPKLLVVAGNDQIAPGSRAREVAASWSNARVVEIAGADHFLVGRTEQVAAICEALAHEIATRGSG